MTKLQIDPIKKPRLLKRMYLNIIQGLLENLTNLTPINNSKKIHWSVNNFAKLKQATKKSYLKLSDLKFIKCKHNENANKIIV
jgi:hypothetical protein